MASLYCSHRIRIAEILGVDYYMIDTQYNSWEAYLYPQLHQHALMKANRVGDPNHTLLAPSFGELRELVRNDRRRDPCCFPAQ